MVCKLLVATLVASTQSARLHTRSNGKCNAYSSVSLCKSTKVGEGFTVDDKKCISRLCDNEQGQKWEHCCTLRHELLLAGELVENFKWDGSGEIKVPAAREGHAVPIHILGFHGQESTETACKESTRWVTFAGTYKVSFKLPESPPGVVPLKCGSTAKNMDEAVRFVCGEDFRWASETNGSCTELKVCPAENMKVVYHHPYQLYTFPMKKTENHKGEDFDVSVPCPASAHNPRGTARFTCQSNGKWLHKENTCAVRPGDCTKSTKTIKATKGEQTYHLPPAASGAKISLDCRRGSGRGQAHFTCEGGSWSDPDEHECQYRAPEREEPAPLTGGPSCLGGPIGFKLDGHAHTYDLNETAAGSTVHIACEHGRKTSGEVHFKCKNNGQWSIAGHTCEEPLTAGAVCASATINIKGAGGPGRAVAFRLPAAPLGSHEVQCGAPLKGRVYFICKEGGIWDFDHTSPDCKQ